MQSPRSILPGRIPSEFDWKDCLSWAVVILSLKPMIFHGTDPFSTNMSTSAKRYHQIILILSQPRKWASTLQEFVSKKIFSLINALQKAYY
jgi:hypothetical protein